VRRKKRTVSETETHRVVIVRGPSRQAFCEGCRRQVEMFTLDRAAESVSLTASSLRERIPASGGHVVKTGETLWVCAEWLSRLP
jgi:hypothetical protein